MFFADILNATKGGLIVLERKENYFGINVN